MSDIAPFPTALDIELSSACNLKCPMCPRTMPGFKEHRGKIGHMSDRIFGRAYRELMAHEGQCRWLWLHLGGESLLDPQFVERSNLLAATGAFTAVSTNVTPLTEELTDKILRSKLGRLILSIDGVAKETYESVRVGADFEDVMGKVDRLLGMARVMEAKGEKHPAIWLQCLRMDDTEAEVEAFVRKYSDSTEPPQKYQSLRGIKDGKVFLKKHESFASQVEPRGYGWDGASGKGRRFTCRKPFKRATILSDGGVSICCYDIQGRCIVGSLENNSINGIWHSKPMREIRRGFDEAQKQKRGRRKVDNNLFPELCRGC
jgi:hypothetical protein